MAPGGRLARSVTAGAASRASNAPARSPPWCKADLSQEVGGQAALVDEIEHDAMAEGIGRRHGWSGPSEVVALSDVAPPNRYRSRAAPGSIQGVRGHPTG
jgi:hypothetical protein